MATMALLSSVFRWLLSSVLDQNLVQKRASLERKSKSEFARLVFLYDPERSTFVPDRFCSKDHSFRFIRSVTKRLRRPCAQIINKLIICDSEESNHIFLIQSDIVSYDYTYFICLTNIFKHRVNLSRSRS